MERIFLLVKREAPLTTGRLAFFIHPKPLSIAKAKEELGFSPQLDFKTGIAQTVTWCRDQEWL
jgi:dihydroflavonol-4-reductase